MQDKEVLPSGIEVWRDYQYRLNVPYGELVWYFRHPGCCGQGTADSREEAIAAAAAGCEWDNAKPIADPFAPLPQGER